MYSVYYIISLYTDLFYSKLKYKLEIRDKNVYHQWRIFIKSRTMPVEGEQQK